MLQYSDCTYISVITSFIQIKQPYEAAAADAAPPYWETTVITPGVNGDEVFVEGLPVGNFFAFVWNMLGWYSFWD